MESPSVSAKYIIGTLGHTAPDRRNDDFFLALLNESQRHGEARASRSDDRDRPDPYRDKIDPDRNEFRARDRDAERVQRDSAPDDREVEEPRAETRPADDRKADKPRTEREDTAEAPMERDSAPAATEKSDTATTETTAKDPTAPTDSRAGPETAQATSPETATNPSAETAPAQGESVKQPIFAGTTTPGEEPASNAAPTAPQDSTVLPAVASDAAKAVAAVNDPATTAAQAVAAGQSSKTGGAKQPGQTSATSNAESAANGATAVNDNKGGRATGVPSQAATADPGMPSDGRDSDVTQQGRAKPTNPAAMDKSAANNPATPPANADAQGSMATGAKGGTAPGLEQLLANTGKTARTSSGADGATQANHTSPSSHVIQASARPAGATMHNGAQTNQPGQPVHIDDVAVHIQRAAAKGQDRIKIRLNPAELGQIQVQLKRGADGVTRAVVHADRPETLDLLQRDARSLERALNDAGLKTDSNSLSFSLRDHGQGGLQHGEGQASDTPQFADSDSDTRALEEAPQASPPSILSSRALDIRV